MRDKKMRNGEGPQIESGLKGIRESLLEGGPPVDWHQLQQFHDGLLNDSESAQIERNIVTWKQWYDAEIDLLAADSWTEPAVTLEESKVKELIKPTRNLWSYILPRYAIAVAASLAAIVVGAMLYRNRSEVPVPPSFSSAMESLAAHLKPPPLDQINENNISSVIEEFRLFVDELAAVRHEFPERSDQLDALLGERTEPIVTYVLNQRPKLKFDEKRQEIDEETRNALRQGLTRRTRLVELVQTGLNLPEKKPDRRFIPFYVQNARFHQLLGEGEEAEQQITMAELGGIVYYQFRKDGLLARDYLVAKFELGDLKTVYLVYRTVKQSSWCPNTWIQAAAPQAIEATIQLGQSKDAYQVSREYRADLLKRGSVFPQVDANTLLRPVFIGYVHALRTGSFDQTGLTVCLDEFLEAAEWGRKSHVDYADRMTAIAASKYLQCGNIEQGKKLFRSLLASENRYIRGTAMAFLDDFEGAAKELSLVEANPLDEDELRSARNNRIACLIELESDEIDEAVSEFEALVNSNTNEEGIGAYYATLGHAWMKLGDQEKAFDWYDLALESVNAGDSNLPAEITILTSYADALVESGKSLESIEVYETSLASAERYFGNLPSPIVADLQMSLGNVLLGVPSRKAEGEQLIAKAKSVLERSDLSQLRLLLAAW